MEKKCFKELESLYIEDKGKGSQETSQRIESNIQLFGFISNIIDLYLPKARNVIQSLGSFNTNIRSSRVSNNTDKNL